MEDEGGLGGMPKERGIAHRFEVLPGEHAAEYWIENVDRYVAFYDSAFRGSRLALGR